MENLKINLSIVIVNYNVGDKLLNCINSIFETGIKRPFEIIIVENGKENLEKKLRKFKDVRYVKSDLNRGFGGGNNLGAERARGNYLFFLNPDTIVTKGSIGKLIDFYKNKKKVGIASPLLIDKNYKVFQTQSKKELTPINAILSFSFLRKLFPNRSVYNDQDFLTWDLKKPIKVEAIPGAAMLISKKLFEKLGGFDETFFLYFEENDISKRVKELGLNLYIFPQAKVIHEVGQSTKSLEDKTKIFEKSRFLFLKKHYGILKAIFVEGIIRINPLLLIILLLSLFLRIYNISNGMPFIGDYAWFYLSARDMLLHGTIPLVGITSSHIWLHQGPLWTYMLSIFLFLFRFNPLSGVYLTILLGVISTYLIYFIVKNLYSKTAGLIASVLYATSPLIISSDRTPYHTSPIPLLVLIYFYSLSKWVKDKNNFFPLAILAIVLLYNFELATFTLFFPFVVLFLIGLLRKRNWVIGLRNKKIIFLSIAAFVIPMFPILIYDFYNGFKQTVVFFGWTLYKPVNAILSGFSFSSGSVVGFLFTSITKILFYNDLLIAIVIFALSLIFLIYEVIKSSIKLENSNFILLILTAFALAGIIINKTPSDAYLPMIFPLVIISVSRFLSFFTLNSKLKYFVYLFILFTISFNFIAAFNQDKKSLLELLNINVDKITSNTQSNEYNLIGKGPGSQFESFTMNYQYLLWYKNHSPSKSSKSTKVIIESSGDKIEIIKYD